MEKDKWIEHNGVKYHHGDRIMIHTRIRMGKYPDGSFITQPYSYDRIVVCENGKWVLQHPFDT